MTMQTFPTFFTTNALKLCERDQSKAITMKKNCCQEYQLQITLQVVTDKRQHTVNTPSLASLSQM